MRFAVESMPILSSTKFVAVLSENTIMSRTASSSGNEAPISTVDGQISAAGRTT